MYKLILVSLFLLGQVFGQMVIPDTAEVYIDVKGNVPITSFDNSNFVKWFDNLPLEWKQSMVDEGFAEKEKRNGLDYFILTLKSKEWHNISLIEQVYGDIRFTVLPDSTEVFNNHWMIVASDLDTNIVDVDSVEAEVYYFATIPGNPKIEKEKVKYRKKPNGNIDYPNLKQFPTKADKEKWLKKQKKDK